MGIALWLGSGLVAWIVARLVPLGRGTGRWLELAAALTVAALFGVGATALDFGGWREPDWRAGLFAFFGSIAAAGITRALRKKPHGAAVPAPNGQLGGPS